MFVASPLPSLQPAAKAAELDVENLRACQAGDRQALSQFVRCYQHRVFAYLSRNLDRHYPIEDLAQEVFVRAYPALARFDPSQRPKLSTWLLTIAHCVAVDARRRRRLREQSLESEECSSPLPTPEQLLGGAELRRAIERAVASLPAEQREVFVLAEFHDLGTSEIAQVVGALEVTVKTRLFRARARLRQSLESIRLVKV